MVRTSVYVSCILAELHASVEATYWLAEDALKLRELDGLACLHVILQESHRVILADSS